MRKGFSLVEILITIVILAVLAAIAIPNFSKAQEKNDARQAITYLRAIRLAEKVYNAKNGTYAGPYTNAAAIKTALGVEIAAGKWDFSVTAVSSTTFLATATRVADGSYISVNASGAWSGTYTPLPTS